jgi:hypothetical protein
VTAQLQLAARDSAAKGAERAGRHRAARNGGNAAAYSAPPPAPAVVDRAHILEAAEAAYAQSLAHAMRARTVEQVRSRFDLADQRMHELRLAARRA